MRPDAISFAELYPEEVRAKICPGCGGGKAPHAELCKKCRTKADRAAGIRRAPRAKTQISDQLLAEAYALYQGGASVKAAARAIFERTPHRNVDSTAQALKREWGRRGWEMRSRRARA